MVNMHDAKSRLSQLVVRAERGDRIIISRARKPAAELDPLRKRKQVSVSQDDPLLNLDEFAVDRPSGELTNPAIDRLLYGTT